MARLLKGKRWRTAIIVAVTALIALLAYSVISARGGQTDAADVTPDSLTFTGRSTESVRVVTETVANRITGVIGFATLPGATTSFTTPAGDTDLIRARFAGESACYGAGPAGYCKLRILIDGLEMNPIVGADFAFDSTDAGDETSVSWESKSIDRVKRVGAGFHTVTVQRAVTGAGISFRLDDWALTVEISN